jgi:hypothetical protein
MNNTPQWIKDEWDKVPREKLRCVRAAEGDCKGRLTKEHALEYAGRQIQELWAILDMCAFHHAVDRFQDGGKMMKKVHGVIAAHQATEKELAKYPRKNWHGEYLRFVYDPSQPSLLKKA